MSVVGPYSMRPQNLQKKNIRRHAEFFFREAYRAQGFGWTHFKELKLQGSDITPTRTNGDRVAVLMPMRHPLREGEGFLAVRDTLRSRSGLRDENSEARPRFMFNGR